MTAARRNSFLVGSIAQDLFELVDCLGSRGIHDRGRTRSGFSHPIARARVRERHEIRPTPTDSRVFQVLDVNLSRETILLPLAKNQDFAEGGFGFDFSRDYEIRAQDLIPVERDRVGRQPGHADQERAPYDGESGREDQRPA